MQIARKRLSQPAEFKSCSLLRISKKDLLPNGLHVRGADFTVAADDTAIALTTSRVSGAI